MAINNPLIPGDPFSYDLKWIIRKLKEHSVSIQQIIESIPDEDAIKSFILQMIDSGEINTEVLKSIGVFNVKDYGAVGDQLTDDYQAIMDTYTAAAEINGVMYFPEGTYMIGQGLVFPLPIHVCMIGTIYYPLTGAAVTLGEPGETYNYPTQNWRIQGISAINTGSVGLHMINTNSGKITLEFIDLFETGVICEGDGGGFQNNNILISTISSCANSLVLTSKNVGWCNDNLFIGGRFFVPFSHTYPSVAITLTSSQSFYCNNNVFIKPNVENNTVGVLLDYAKRNTIYKMRTEGATKAFEINNESQMNEISIGFGDLGSVVRSPINDLRESRYISNIQRKTVSTFNFDNFINNSACNSGNGSVKDIYAPGSPMTDYNYELKYTLGTEGIVLSASRSVFAEFDIRKQEGNYVMIRPVFKADTIRGFVTFYDENGASIAADPPQFENQGWTPQTISGDTAFRTGANPDPEGFVVGIPANTVRMRAGIQTTGSTEMIGMTIETTAQASIRTHLPILPTIPTVNGNKVGQMAFGTNGQFWVWDGSSWKTVTTA